MNIACSLYITFKKKIKMKHIKQTKDVLQVQNVLKSD